MIYSTSPKVAVSSSRNNDSLHRTQTFAARFRSVGVVLAVAVVCSILLFPLTTPAQTATGATWNNTGLQWTEGTSWVGGSAPTNDNSLAGNIATFSNAAAGFNTVNLSSDRSIYGVLFTAGANAYTFTGNPLTVGNGGGISNASASLQTFSNRVINTGTNPVYGSYAGGSLLFAGGINLTPSNSSASRTVVFLGSGAVTVSGAIAAGGTSTGGNLIFGNAALNTLSGNNTYFGTTTVSNGSTLRLGSATALGATNGGTEIKSGGALDLNGQTIGAEALAINGTGVSSNGVIFNSSASAATWSGNITPSGNSTIKATNGSITLSGGIDLNNNTNNSRTLTLDGTGEIIVSGNISNSFAGSTGSLTKTGSGTVTLSGANTYSGTTKISAGTLRLSGTSALSTNGVIAGASSSGDNSTLRLAGGGDYVSSAFGSTNDNGGTMNFTNSSGSAATLTFTAATNYVTRSSDSAGGRTVANQSTNLGLVFNGAVDIGSSTVNNVTFGGAGNTTVKGVIFNTNTAVARGVTKTGSGILSLEGANSYNGPTTVSAGSLIVASTGSLSSSAVSISNGATFRYNGSSALASTITVGGDGSGRAVLGGTGTINSAVALNSTNDVLSPGNSPGIQNFTPSQTWSSFTYDWELNNFTGTTAGTAFDQISIAGALNLSGSNYTLNVISLTAGNVPGNVPNFTEVDTSWTILVASGGISGFDSAEWLVDTNSFSALGSIAGRFTISQSANNLNLNYVVPEPSTYALLGVSALACGAWFVRRRRKS
jgi:autotransporter-associated beta strand protein